MSQKLENIKTRRLRPDRMQVTWGTRLEDRTVGFYDRRALTPSRPFEWVPADGERSDHTCINIVTFHGREPWFDGRPGGVEHGVRVHPEHPQQRRLQPVPALERQLRHGRGTCGKAMYGTVKRVDQMDATSSIIKGAGKGDDNFNLELGTGVVVDAATENNGYVWPHS